METYLGHESLICLPTGPKAVFQTQQHDARIWRELKARGEHLGGEVTTQTQQLLRGRTGQPLEHAP